MMGFHLNVQSGAGHCWHADCGWKSRHAAPLLLRKLRAEAATDGAGVEVPEESEPVRLPEDFARLSKPADSLDRRAVNYLLKRGVTRQQILRHRIGVSYVGTYAYRIIFPVIVDKTLRAIVARDFTGRSKRRYLNSAGDAWLWNFDPAAKEIILAEGIFKALRITTATGMPAGALLGHNFTDTKLRQIRDSACRHVILWPDPDRVGRRGAMAVAGKLKEEWRGKVSIIWPVTTPADETPLDELRRMAAQPQLYNWFLQAQILQHD
jgi:DNA primase